MRNVIPLVRHASRALFAWLALLWLPATLLAWGPHPEITEAAVAALGPGDALVGILGPEIGMLREHCWMGDNRTKLMQITDQWFYADDYLLCPGAPGHVDHLCPAVKVTYKPFFLRALQALRTETPINAARSIGAILHFTEDTGSPPHAGEVGGTLHSKMENWVDAKAIVLPGYRPQLLGKTDDEAVAGFLNRMDGLIVFSRKVFDRAKPHVEADDRAGTEPIVLESALETSRVVADLLHTLGYLAEQPQSGTAGLRGKITSLPAVGMEKLPAKIILLGTSYSTLADAEGTYQFRQLPPGQYKLAVLRPGSLTLRGEVTLAADKENRFDATLQAGPEGPNLLRNADMQLVWGAAPLPDGWIAGGKDAWAGEYLQLVPGQNYRLIVDWQEGAQGEVFVRRMVNLKYGTPVVDSKRLKPGNKELTFSGSEQDVYAQIRIQGSAAPGAICKKITVVPIP